jgi:hypothetical protein
MKEAIMKRSDMLCVVTIALLALGISLVMPGIGWAQQAVPPSEGPAAGPQAEAAPAPADDSSGLTAMAAVAGTIGSAFYIPFKLAAICPSMTLAAGVHYVATAGKDTATDEYLLRAGCAGTYFITPGMVRGQEEFQGSGTR